MEYAFYMSNGESTYKCGAYVKELHTVRNEDTPIRTLRSASTSDLEKKVVSPGRDLIIPEIANVESISVQLETIYPNSVFTNNLIESLIQVVSKLSEEVGLLRKDNEILKIKDFLTWITKLLKITLIHWKTNYTHKISV
jgi:hypothetical protein